MGREQARTAARDRVAQQHHEEKDITLETLERAVGFQAKVDRSAIRRREGNHTRDIGKRCGLFRQNWNAQRHHEEKEITLETLERAVGCSDKTGLPSNTAKRKNHTRDIEKGCGLFRQDRIAQ